MKTVKVLAVLFLLSGSLLQAQVSVNVNIGAPVWAPATPVGVNYYYLPDIETYYDVHTRHYIYINNGRWIRERSLPVRYHHYDLHKGRKIVVVDDSPRPYRHFHKHKVKYRPVVVHERPHYYADRHDKHQHKKHKHHKHDRRHGRD